MGRTGDRDTGAQRELRGRIKKQTERLQQRKEDGGKPMRADERAAEVNGPVVSTSGPSQLPPGDPGQGVHTPWMRCPQLFPVNQMAAVSHFN